jgi:FtsZ-interacting cell division protein YlmF
MAIKFPKIGKKDEEFDDLYSVYDDEIEEVDDSDVKVNEVELEPVEAAEDKKAFSGINEAAVSLKLMAPKEFSEATKVADCLMAGSSVVLNIENIDPKDIVRFMDFLMGVIYVIDGNMKHVSKTTVIVTPKNVGVDGDTDIEA